MDKLIERQHIAHYVDQLQMETDPVKQDHRDGISHAHAFGSNRDNRG